MHSATELFMPSYSDRALTDNSAAVVQAFVLPTLYQSSIARRRYVEQTLTYFMYILVLKYLIWILKVVLFKISLLSSNRPARTGPSPAIVTLPDQV